MLRKILVITFSILALYYVFLFDSISPALTMLFKLLPMLLLIGLALTTPSPTPYKRWLIIGLVFCAVGDYTLQWFLIGLSSFLIGHVFYIIAFRSVRITTTPSLIKICMMIYGLAMVFLLAGTLWQRGETVLALSVCAYITIILCMGWTSFRTAQPLVIFGALLFITSDSVLAINRFVTAIPFAHELIMFTYYGAQLFLTLSLASLNKKVIQY